MTAGATPASADATVFVGLATPAAPHPMFGVSWGLARRIVGFEIEYAWTRSDVRPSLGTIGANILVQLPPIVDGVQFYSAAGKGLIAETFANGGGSYGDSGNVGGGAKLPLVGALKLRLDYRYFFFTSGEPESPLRYLHSHRISAGVNLTF